MNQIAVNDPELKEEAQEALNTVIEKDVRNLDDGKKSEDQLMAQVKANMQKVFAELKEKFEGKHKEKESSEESSEGIELPTLTRENQESIIVGERDVEVLPPVLEGLNVSEVPVLTEIESPSKCSPGMIEILLRRMRLMVIENQIQNVRIFQENVTHCQYVKQEKRLDAILSFNFESCYLGIYSNDHHDHESTYLLLSDDEKDSFSLPTEGMGNCIFRLGTDDLYTAYSN